jgi:putative heme iron utilization protein
MTAATEARALVRAARSGSLGTLSDSGAPFVSLVAVVDDGRGAPLFLISGLAEHTRNLRRRPEASLLISTDGATMDRPRVSLTGKVVFLEGDDAAAAQAVFTAALPEAKVWASLPDFVPARLEVDGARFVAGFGRAVSLSAEDYRSP